jgi:heat shock protein HslJ
MKTQAFAKIGTGLALAFASVACGGSSGGPAASTPPPTVAGGSGVPSQDRLGLAGSWQLVSLTETGQPPVAVAAPDRFTATFGDDGRVSLLADCNRCSGSYRATSTGLSVGLMACTLAACESAPLDTKFAGLVGQATSWTTGDGALELRCDAGVLRLRR